MITASRSRQARQARALVEAALDGASVGGRWPWVLRWSRYLDLLLVIEESVT